MNNIFEQEYCNITSKEHRKKFGQFYTPNIISDFMMSKILKNNPKSILDPSFGLGEFYESFKKINIDNNIKFYANEIDNLSYNYYIDNINDKIENNLNLYNEDYFKNWTNKYDAIICNPPYIKFQNIDNNITILNKLKNIYNEKISGYTNLSSLFLLKSIYELNPDGILCYIMPLEFLNTTYGENIKKILLSYGSINEIIHIKNEKSIFPDANTTICILVFTKNKKIDYIKFSYGTDIKRLKTNFVYISNISYNEKWLRYFSDKIQMNKNNSLVPITEYGKFKRGIATGNNNFFILNDNTIKSYNISKYEYVPCITKSQIINKDIITDDDITCYDDTKLFYPNNKLSEGALSYIKYGESLNYDKTYITSHRKYWLMIENIKRFPLLISVFYRNKPKIVINKSNYYNLTCFHGFEPKKEYENYIDIIFDYLHTKDAEKYFDINKRLYGNNLYKFEPNDLNKILVPKLL